MNIAFVANGHKTEFFHLISKSMKEKEAELKIYWICAAKFQYDYLLSCGYQPDNILLLNWDIGKDYDRKVIGEYKLHELVYGDRVLKYNFDEGTEYLKTMQSLFYEFVVEKDLQYIFGEMTWAHELLMNRICRDKFVGKCFYLHPQSVRIPNGRFTFMDTEFQNTIFSKAEYIHGEEENEKFQLPIKPVVPERVADVAKDVKYSLTLEYKIKRVKNFLVQNRLRNRPKDNLQSPPLLKAVSKFINVARNQRYYTRYLKKAKLADLENKKFFLITLHMQPEASVDVVGRYYEDQFLVIRDVWRILPNDYYLVIKEHTNAIGNRGKEFFERCLALRNVIIIDEKTNSHQLLELAETVFTNSGTVALEGALFKKDVFLFSNIFFDKLKYCHRISLDDLKETANYFELLEKCRVRDSSKMTCEDFSNYIIRSSFSGVIDGHKGSPYYTDRTNIETIAKNFVLFISN